MSRILESWQNPKCFNVVCSPLWGGSCCSRAQRGCSWQHPDKISFLGFFTQACLKGSNSPRMISPVCALPCPSALLGLCSWIPLAHVYTVAILRDLASSHSLRRLFDCLMSLFWCFFCVTSNLCNFHSFSNPFPSSSHLLSFTIKVWCLYSVGKREYSLVSYTSLPDWAITILPWICPGNNPMRSELLLGK